MRGHEAVDERPHAAVLGGSAHGAVPADDELRVPLDAVQGHLRDGLAEGLRGEHADHLPGGDAGSVPALHGLRGDGGGVGLVGGEQVGDDVADLGHGLELPEQVGHRAAVDDRGAPEAPLAREEPVHGHGGRHPRGAVRHELEVRRVAPVVAVGELDDGAVRVAHGHVRVRGESLEAFDELPLDVAALARLHGRVHEPLAAADGVEEVVVGREALHEGVAHHAAGLGGVLARREAGQRPVADGARDALPLYVLLAQAGHDLQDVHVGPLRARVHEATQAVVAVDGLERGAPHGVAGLVQAPVDPGLARVGARAELLHRLLVDLAHALADLGRRQKVRHADGEPLRGEPVGHAALQARHKVHRRARPHVVEDDVHERPLRPPQRLLVQLAAQEDAVRDVGVRRRRAQADPARKHHGEGLRPRPERARVDDGRRRHGKVVDVHAPVHHVRAVQEGVLGGELVGADERVLYDGHDRAVRLRGDDVLLDAHELRGLHLRLDGLQRVQVHLVAVKVRVVGRRARQVEPEGAPRHDAHAVAHDGGPVQRGLAVEEDLVAVLEGPLHLPARLQTQVVGGPLQVHAVPLRVDGVLAAREEPLEPLQVVVVDALRDREHARDLRGHAHLVHVQRRVARDDAPRGKVAPLAHERTAHAALLLAQALRDAPLRVLLRPVQVVAALRLEAADRAAHALRGVRLFQPRQSVVLADDLEQLLGDAVLPADLVAMDGRGRADGRRRHGQHLHDARGLLHAEPGQHLRAHELLHVRDLHGRATDLALLPGLPVRAVAGATGAPEAVQQQRVHPRVHHGLGQLQMAKVARTLGPTLVTRDARAASRGPQALVAEPPGRRLAILLVEPARGDLNHGPGTDGGLRRPGESDRRGHVLSHGGL